MIISNLITDLPRANFSMEYVKLGTPFTACLLSQVYVFNCCSPAGGKEAGKGWWWGVKAARTQHYMTEKDW